MAGDIFGHHGGKGRYYWHLVGGGQGYCSTPYTTLHNMARNAKNDPAQDIRGALRGTKTDQSRIVILDQESEKHSVYNC